MIEVANIIRVDENGHVHTNKCVMANQENDKDGPALNGKYAGMPFEKAAGLVFWDECCLLDKRLPKTPEEVVDWNGNLPSFDDGVFEHNGCGVFLSWPERNY